MVVDNFDLIRGRLEFETDPKTGSTFDRYIVNILRRVKDFPEKDFEKNESSRMIKTFEIMSADYFDRKRETIIDLCEKNSARAYFLPQVRSSRDCLKSLIKECLENLDNPVTKISSLARKSICGTHTSRSKRWVLDLDEKELRGYPYDLVMEIVRKNLTKCGKNPDDAFWVPTVHGKHIVTPPFNLLEANKRCEYLFEGTKTFEERVPCGPGEYETIRHKVNGWLHKDGATVLYASVKD